MICGLENFKQRVSEWPNSFFFSVLSYRSFTSIGLENVTRRSGNFKSFPVLVRMIVTALANRSDSVVIQFLTRTQLELLFKTNASGKSSTSGSGGGNNINNNRYFLITYKAEFDHVKYPLPLIHSSPSVQRLQAKLGELREELSSERRLKSNEEQTKLRQENERLKIRLKVLEKANEQGASDSEIERIVERYKNEYVKYTWLYG